MTSGYIAAVDIVVGHWWQASIRADADPTELFRGQAVAEKALRRDVDNRK
jgi:hypothetical protein